MSSRSRKKKSRTCFGAMTSWHAIYQRRRRRPTICSWKILHTIMNVTHCNFVIIDKYSLYSREQSRTHSPRTDNKFGVLKKRSCIFDFAFYFFLFLGEIHAMSFSCTNSLVMSQRLFKCIIIYLLNGFGTETTELLNTERSSRRAEVE